MTKARIVTSFALIVTSALLVSCGKTASSPSGGTNFEVTPGQTACYNAAASQSFVSASGSGSNAVPVTVQYAGVCSFNAPCASVTVCTPGNTNQCQVIPNVLVDTGSYGLRIFSQALPSNLCGSLTQVTSGGSPVAECAQFGSAATWGPIMMASIQLGGETPVQMPIQVINQGFSYAPSQCSTGVTAPGGDGSPFNGILGIGLFKYDCSDVGSCPSAANAYFSCAGSSCSAINMPEASQVVNPVAKLSQDNNGVTFDFSGFVGTGQASASGTMYLGINTAGGNNNPSGTTKVYQVGNVEYSNFPTFMTTTLYGGGTTFHYGSVNAGNVSASTFSFLDSGTNVLLMPASDSGMPDCSDAQGFLCPPSTVNYSATVQGETCTGVSGVNCSVNGSTGTNGFQVANFDVLANGSNYAMTNVGADSAGGLAISEPVFTWGMPFFLGKKIYVGLDGTTATINSVPTTGPYWCY